MKPSKRCDLCNKPIWDHDFVSIYDPYMDAEVDIHGGCYEKERQQHIDDICEDAMTMETDFHR